MLLFAVRLRDLEINDKFFLFKSDLAVTLHYNNPNILVFPEAIYMRIFIIILLQSLCLHYNSYMLSKYSPSLMMTLK